MAHTATSTGLSAPSSRHPTIVVGVNGSERNQAAVDWASTEAARAGQELRLIAVAFISVAPPSRGRPV